MRKLYILTLEPLEQRYTKQWYEFWKTEFSKSFDVKYIDANYKGDKIEKGRFLDINKTNLYKAQQVEKIAELFGNNKIKDNDIFLLMDGWNFAITALKYMAQLNKINIKIYTYLHAGTWDKEDFISQAGLRDWAVYNECGWFNACDGHFVATRFHKNLITEYFNGHIQNNKIHVVGFPMDWSNEIEKRMSLITYKEDIIVFPHRLDKEKSPEVFKVLAKQMPKYKFIFTMEATHNKKEYYRLLQRAKVVFSASLQETFGIGTVEGLMLGCVPVVPEGLSYIELYEKRFRYTSFKAAKQKIEWNMNNYNNKHLQEALEKNRNKIQTASMNAIPMMVKVMLK